MDEEGREKGREGREREKGSEGKREQMKGIQNRRK